MKNNMIFIASFFTLFAQAMEPENKWSITAYGTKISLYKDDILEHYADENKKIDVVICVGQYKQEELGETPIGGNVTGKCWKQKTVRFSPKEDSINYQKARTCGWDFPQREGIQFLVVTEPRVFNQPGEDSKYWFDDSECYTKEAAITESCKSLLDCYNAVLNAGIELQKEKNIKNIALSMLGADSQYEHARMFKEDVVPIAVNSVVEFLRNKRGVYDNLEFFVDEGSDFDLYKKAVIEQYYELTAKICLFLLAQQDSASTLLMLPRDLIHYIAKLIPHN
jgi:hypothetical protein